MTDKKLRDFVEQHFRTLTYADRARSYRSKKHVDAQVKNISPPRRTIIEQSFHGDYEVLSQFHRNVFDSPIEREPGSFAERMPYRAVVALLRFPSALGADPMDEQTVEWAREFFDRYAGRWESSDGIAEGYTQTMLRSASVLYKARVPLEYVREYFPGEERFSKEDAARAVSAYQSGLAPEYARTIWGA